MKKLKPVGLSAMLVLVCVISGIWIYGKIPPSLDWKQPEFKSMYSSLEWKSYHNVPLSALRLNAKITWMGFTDDFIPDERGNPDCNRERSLSHQLSFIMGPYLYECLIVSNARGTTTVNSLEMFRQMFIPVNTPEKALVFVDARGERSGDVAQISGGYLVRTRNEAHSSCGYGTRYSTDEIWFVRESGEVTLVAKQGKPNSEYWCSLWGSIRYRNTPNVLNAI
jgi:hypothetical protein